MAITLMNKPAKISPGKIPARYNSGTELSVKRP